MDMKALGSPMPQKDWSPAREKCRAAPFAWKDKLP